jgi:hypothetical protein
MDSDPMIAETVKLGLLEHMADYHNLMVVATVWDETDSQQKTANSAFSTLTAWDPFLRSFACCKAKATWAELYSREHASPG